MLKSTTLRVLIGSLILLLAGACTTNPPMDVPVEEKLAKLGYELGPQVKHINNFRINGWNIVDRSNVIVFVSASHSYLVTTRLPCDGFQDTEHLNYSVTAGKLTDRDKLLVRRSSGHMQGCFIDTLFELKKIKN
jgi:hypothetical protein